MGSTDDPVPRTRARVIGKLTTLSVRQQHRRGLFGDGGGLFLQVSERGAKSWIFRFKKDGRLRVMGLGPVHTVSLAEAREAASIRSTRDGLGASKNGSRRRGR